MPDVGDDLELRSGDALGEEPRRLERHRAVFFSGDDEHRLSDGLERVRDVPVSIIPRTRSGASSAICNAIIDPTELPTSTAAPTPAWSSTDSVSLAISPMA